MNNGRQHWVTAFFTPGCTTVTVLDSMRRTDVSGHLKNQIAMVLKCQKDTFKIIRPPCKQQLNGVDCGVFAIANALNLCSQGKPEFVDFDDSTMRRHLLQCMEKGVLTPFPRISKRAKKSPPDDLEVTVNVYCFCRLPGGYDDLVGCDGEGQGCEKWFHISCVGLKTVPDEEWICPKCSQSS